MKLFSHTIGQGPDIVLLHGWGIHSGIWQFITAQLREEFRITTIDLPGYGRSDVIPDYALVNIVEHLLPAIPTEAIWIGWSLGALIAIKLALLYPQHVRKLICVASTPKFMKEQGWPGIDMSILQKFSEQLFVEYEKTLMRFLLLQFYGIPLDKSMLQWLQQNLFLYGKPTLHTLNAGLNLLKTVDLRHELNNLPCPTFYILGKLDRLVPSDVAQALPHYQSKVQTVVFPKASHALFLSHETEFLNAVRRFSYE
jgi:pimeloyl-[acyl-carrier protein] methyl ester esterase